MKWILNPSNGSTKDDDCAKAMWKMTDVTQLSDIGDSEDRPDIRKNIMIHLCTIQSSNENATLFCSLSDDDIFTK